MKLKYDRHETMRSVSLLLCLALLFSNSVIAQSEVRIDAPNGGLGWLTRPYQPRSVPPINLANSSRLESLERAGNLYLSAQDVVALAIENNIDVEVQRYGPLLAREVLRRAQSGGALRLVGQIGDHLRHACAERSLSVSQAAQRGVHPRLELGPSIPLLDQQLPLLPNSST
jgi:hypothetical protein